MLLCLLSLAAHAHPAEPVVTKAAVSMAAVQAAPADLHTGAWSLRAWGEDFVEQGIGSEVFTDGCRVQFDTFDVKIASWQLLDGLGWPIDEGSDDITLNLVDGDQPVASFHHAPDAFRFQIELASVAVTGTLRCGGRRVGLDWTFEQPTLVACPIDATRAEATLTLHADHLFYDGLHEGAQVRGRSLVRADTDGDGLLSLHEMTAEQRETLHALAGTMAHVDGETSCSVAQRR